MRRDVVLRYFKILSRKAAQFPDVRLFVACVPLIPRPVYSDTELPWNKASLEARHIKQWICKCLRKKRQPDGRLWRNVHSVSFRLDASSVTGTFRLMLYVQSLSSLSVFRDNFKLCAYSKTTNDLTYSSVGKEGLPTNSQKHIYHINTLKTEFLLNNIHKFQFVPHRKHITSPLQSPTG
jgi:hypothetical protein